MHLETSSNIYGVTVNPYNRFLTSGGSSGGEGALIGLRGSCLGIGTVSHATLGTRLVQSTALILATGYWWQ
jgi:hypothetical protein